jgi:hypothetical protein
MNVLVCGRIKEGKTTLAKALAYEWSDGVVIWDPRHMIEGGSYVRNADELEDVITDQAWKKGPIVFRPDGLRLEEQFDEMCEVLFTPPERFDNFSLVVDEAGDMQSAHRIQPHLSRCLRQHPRSVMVIQTTHSLQDYARPSKDLMNCMYCFRVIGRSLKSVIEFCDGSDELREAIETLPRHHCVRINFEASNDEKEFVVIKPDWFHGGPIHEQGDEENAGAEENSTVV